MNEIKQIDITPSTTIYSTFKRYNYKPVSAIAEFLDNSTQSYINNKNRFGNISPVVYIIYDATPNNESLKIVDNCFGIDEINLQRVLKLNELPKDTKGRNEFGMGLKTSAFWFGDRLEILTKHIDSNKTVELILDLDDIKDGSHTVIPTYYDDGYYNDFYKKEIKSNKNFYFGTTITIKRLSRKITDKTLKKLCKILASKYRDDINHNNLTIKIIKNLKINDRGRQLNLIYNCFKPNDKDEFMLINSFDEVLKLEFKYLDFKKNEKNKEIKIDIDFNFDFNNYNYKVNGVIGILEKGSRDEAGLSLIRRGRTIKGDEDNAYKPKEIFGNSGSFEFQRIYGWLNLDDFPVTFSKDDFEWSDGLEEIFLENLKKNLKNEEFDIIKLAKTIRYNDTTPVEVKKIFNKDSLEMMETDLSNNKMFREVKTEYDLSKDDNNFKITDIYGDVYNFKVILEMKKENENNWLIIEKISNDNFLLFINFKHKFFNPFNENENMVRTQIIKFCVYFAYAEIKHNKSCVLSNELRNVMNELFEKEK